MSFQQKNASHGSCDCGMSCLRVFIPVLSLQANATLPVNGIRILFEEQLCWICSTRRSNLHDRSILIQFPYTTKKLSLAMPRSFFDLQCLNVRNEIIGLGNWRHRRLTPSVDGCGESSSRMGCNSVEMYCKDEKWYVNVLS